MCGVADYTARLAAAFDAIGAKATVEFLDQWSFSRIIEIRRRYGTGGPTIFHMQYPSLHVGYSISPGFLPLLLPNTFVTLHEFRLFNILRKLIFFAPSFLSRKVIFSNDEEKALFQRYFPHSEKRLTVVPIGNNIANVSPRPDAPPDARRPERIIYFGQISHNKGIEFFIETIALLRARKIEIEAELIGALVETDVAFVDFVKKSTELHDIRLRLNLPPEAVSEALNAATIALLPFPDGISNKRGSALACLDHGVSVLTTHSHLTPEWLAQVTHAISSPEDAAGLVSRIMAGEVARSRAADILAREMHARDWKEIAREHLRIYQAFPHRG